MSTVDLIVFFLVSKHLLWIKVSQKTLLSLILYSLALSKLVICLVPSLNVFLKYALRSNGEQTTCSCNLKLICANLTINFIIKTPKT